MKQTRQPVCAIKQSIYLDVYGLSTDLCCLLRLQEIVVTVATANIIGPHVVPKHSKNINILMA
jgi:hypothetical protein